MKIIEALKGIKDLKRKADDLKAKVERYCADLDCETPTYPDQKRQIAEWLQSHDDIIKEILRLKLSIQKTNIATNVTIILGNKSVEKSIAEWIIRRAELARENESMWRKLTDRNLRETYTNKLTEGTPERIIKRRLYFDPKERDEKIELYRSEPSKIDSTLEIINAITDLI